MIKQKSVSLINSNMAEPNSSTKFPFLIPSALAPKNVDGNSFEKFTETLQNGQSSRPGIKKPNAQHFIPLPIPKNIPPVRQEVDVVNNMGVVAINQENITTDINKKTELKSMDLLRTLKLATGTVESTLKWIKKFDSQLMIYEIYANILSIRPGKHITEKIVLLRNSTGPVLQAVFYEIDIEMPNVQNGDLIRCIGRVSDSSRLHILKIKKITAKEMKNAERLMAITNFSLNK